MKMLKQMQRHTTWKRDTEHPRQYQGHGPTIVLFHSQKVLRKCGDYQETTYGLGPTVSLGENSSHNAVSARQSNQHQPGKYVACINDRDWYIGNIVERSEDNSDVYVKFMKRSQNNPLSWPQGLQDECWVPFQDVLCIY
ncbi:hypothetical protein HOLleu_32098 [Holothuria leucospilota]|uniref:Uncharacterized protein n=1 Tax=Holothuria leucospilota TaxID=206669 RepID=A0A9Q1BIF0_HOLLE|nr:hypothetical protein HOLleu_32098 [Holothuria leucospilota]